MGWISNNLLQTADLWNEKVQQVYLNLITPLEENQTMWNIITKINEALQPIALALLVLFFVIGLVKTCSSFTEIKKPEHALRYFLRFAIAKGIVTYGMFIMQRIMQIVYILILTIFSSNGGQMFSARPPADIYLKIESCGFFESIPLGAVTILGGLFVTIIAFVIILTVYGRFFKIYMYVAISPIPLSTFSSEATQNIGKSFLKSFVGVCMEGVVIVLAIIIFNAFVSSMPNINMNQDAISIVWAYYGQLAFNLLILLGTVRASDRIVREMMGI